MDMSIFSIADRVAIVIGARSGMGKDIALTFAKAGANVAVCDIVTEDGALDSLAVEIRKIGRPSLALQVDASVKANVEAMVQQVVEEFGKVDILVNCAAIITRVPLYQCPEEDWNRVMDVNLKGYFLCSQAVSEYMIKRKSGNIINISGLGGISPLKSTGAYPVAKAGVMMLTKQLAFELAEHNIRVNDICPWFVATPISETPRRQWGKQIVSGVPLGRLGEASDISSAALFLASGASSWITGHSLVLDGGHLLVCNDITR